MTSLLDRKQRVLLQAFLLASFGAALSGCGGDSGGTPISSDDGGSGVVIPDPDPDPTTPGVENVAPVAEAGADQRALAGTTLYLPGSGQDSDGSIASYEWVQVDGTSAIINNATAATTTVVLPAVTTNETLSFSLTVTDNDGASDTDAMSVTLFVEADKVSNALPIADAGSDQVVATGTDVLLSGLGDDFDGIIEKYTWVQTNGTSVTLTDADTSTPSFTAPDVNGQETLTFGLTVEDNDGATGVDDVDVEVYSLMTPPENLAVDVAPGLLTVSWDVVAGAESYNLYYANESFDGVDIADYATQLNGTLEVGIDDTEFEIESPNSVTDFYFIVTAVRADDESVGSAEVMATSEVDIIIGATNLLNDTGFEKYSDDSDADLELELDSHPGQDADHGRDNDAVAGTLVKAGSGRVGFDFFKVNSSGRSVGVDEESWDCTFDNRTGLIWEVKKAPDGSDIQSADVSFSWYFSDESISGINKDGADTGESCDFGSRCTTEFYVAEINKIALCGHTNWRLPTVNELKSIVDHGVLQPAIDADFFPNTRTVSSYWTSAIVANNKVNMKSDVLTDSAWAVEFNTGQVVQNLRKTELLIRVVSGESDETE